MDRFQKNTVKSFRRVKEDMRNLQAQLTEIMRQHEEMMDKVSSLDKKRNDQKTTSRKR